jgi:hypothetical protein
MVRQSNPIVGNDSIQPPVLHEHFKPAVASLRVLDDVGQRFLHDPVRGNFDGSRERREVRNDGLDRQIIT